MTQSGNAALADEIQDWLESKTEEGGCSFLLSDEDWPLIVSALRLREALAKGEIALCSGDGEYQIKITFQMQSEMVMAYRALAPLKDRP